MFESISQISGKKVMGILGCYFRLAGLCPRKNIMIMEFDSLYHLVSGTYAIVMFVNSDDSKILDYKLHILCLQIKTSYQFQMDLK